MMVIYRGICPQPPPVRMGFTLGGAGCDGNSAGKRDGNGLIESGDAGQSGIKIPSYWWNQNEPSLFWRDIGNNSTMFCGAGNNQACSGAGLIDFTTNFTAQCAMGTGFWIGGGNVQNFIPSAKLGKNNYIYVYSVNGFNYFGLIVPPVGAWLNPTFGITPLQAYNIDQKIDDGIATTGNVQASYTGIFGIKAYCATTNGSDCTAPLAPFAPTTANEPTTSTSCYNSTTNAYSTKLYPNNLNCALSFKFQ